MAAFKDTLLLEDKVSETLKKIKDNARKTTEKTNKLQEKINQLGCNLTTICQKFNAAGNKMKTLGDKITGTVTKIGAVATSLGAAFVLGLNKASDYADKIDKMSQKIGMSTEKYQEMNFVLSQNGMNVDQLQMGYKTLTNKMAAAQKGSKNALTLFRNLNVSIKDANGQLRNSDDVFDDTLKSLLAMKNPTERMASVIQLFGRNAQELAPLLNNGLESYENLKRVAREKGMILSGEEIANAVKYKDTADKFTKMLETRIASVAIKYMPQFSECFDKIISRIGFMDNAITSLAKIISGIVNIINLFMNLSESGKTAIGVLGRLFVVLGPLLSITGSVIMVLGGIATALGSTIGVVTGSVGVFLGWTGVIAGLVAGIWAAIQAVNLLVESIQHLNRMKINSLNTNFNEEQLNKLAGLQVSMGDKAFAKKYGKEVVRAVTNHRENNYDNRQDNRSNFGNSFQTINNYNSIMPFYGNPQYSI